MKPEFTRVLLEDSERIRNLARWLARDADAADEVVQRAWVAALERPPAHATHLSGWFQTVVTNVARRLGRDQKRRERLDRRVEEPRRPECTPDELFERAVLHRHVVDRVSELPEHYRTVILLRFFEGLETKAIAQRLEVSVETVRTRLSRGLERLRTKLETDPETRDWRLLALPLSSAPRASSSLLTGVLIMSLKSKLFIAASVVVAASLWWGWPTDDREALEGTASTPTAAVDSTEPVSNSATAEANGEIVPTEAARPDSESDTELTPEVVAVTTPFAITGRVLDRDGAPAAGVLVLAGDAAELPWLSEGWRSAGDHIERPESELDPRLLQTRSDEKGRFRFPNLHAGNWGLAARDPRLGLGFSPGVGLDDEFPTAEQDVDLEGGVTLSGVIRDESSGEPLADAYVVLSVIWENEQGQSVGTTWSNVRSDTEGVYRFFPLPYVEYQLSAHHDGYLSKSVGRLEVSAGTKSKSVDVELAPARSFFGQLVDHDGEPAALAQAIVRRRPGGSGFVGRVEVCLSRERPSSVDFFRVDVHRVGSVNLAESSYRVTESSAESEYVSVWYRDALLGEARLQPSDSSTDIVVDLDRVPEEPPQVTVEVVARDAESGERIPEYSFECQRLVRGFTSFSRAILRGDGKQPKRAIEANQRYRVRVQAEGYAERSLAVLYAPELSKATLVVELRPRESTVRGQVRDEFDEPILAADIFVYDPTTDPPLMIAETRTDRDGLYAVAGLGAGEYWVAAEIEGRVPSGRLVSIGAGENAVDLTLTGGVRFEVRVSNTPVGFSLRLLGEEGLPLVDDSRRGTSRFGGGEFVLDRRKEYTLVIGGPKRKVARVRLRPRDSEKLELTLQAE